MVAQTTSRDAEGKKKGGQDRRGKGGWCFQIVYEGKKTFCGGEKGQNLSVPRAGGTTGLRFCGEEGGPAIGKKIPVGQKKVPLFLPGDEEGQAKSQGTGD